MKKYKIIGKTIQPKIGKLYSDIGEISWYTTIFKCISLNTESNTAMFEKISENNCRYMSEVDGYYNFCNGVNYFYEVVEVTEFEIIKVNIEHINLN